MAGRSFAVELSMQTTAQKTASNQDDGVVYGQASLPYATKSRSCNTFIRRDREVRFLVTPLEPILHARSTIQNLASAGNKISHHLGQDFISH